MAGCITKNVFRNLVKEACIDDPDLRHEIERAKDYDSFNYAFDIAYDLVCRHFLSIREAFGLTEKR